MTHAQDTSAPDSGASAHPAAPARPVFLVGESGSFPPAATAAETIFRTWQGLPSLAAPALVWAHPRVAPALIDHLRSRVLAASTQTVADPSAVHAAVLGAVDQGAALLAGGLPSGRRAYAPTLLVHLPADARLAQAQAPVGPLLGVYDAQLAAAPILAALTGSLTIHHLNADGQLDSSPHPEAT